MDSLKRVRVADLTIGTYIQKFDGPWLEHGFWRRSFFVRDEDALKQLHDNGVEFVWINTARGKDVVESAPATTSDDAVGTDEVDQHCDDPGDVHEDDDDDDFVLELAEVPEDGDQDVPSESPPPKFMDPHDVKFEKRASRLHRADRESPPSEADWQRAQKVCSMAKKVVTKVFDDVRAGRTIETETVMPVVDGVIDSVSDQPGTLTSLARLKQQDQYTFMHSVAVCSLMTTLALELGLEDDAVREAATAGLVHDIGKMAVDIKVLNKPGKLTDAEFDEIKRHTTEGHRILQQAGGVGPVALDVARHHHERLDGKGYPDSLAGDQISLFARMGTICDVYDAVTSDRPYKKAWEPTVALHHMSKWAAGAYDPVVFQAFVKSIGVFPNGSLVRLESGRLAVVVDQHHESLLTPVVKVFYSTKSRQPLAHEILNLARAKEKIVSREEPSKWGFKDLTSLWVPVDPRRI